MHELSPFRVQYPVFSDRTYLATACLGPTPRRAELDAGDYLLERRLHNRVLERWFERLGELRGLVERLLSAPPDSVALLDSATACQAAVLASIDATPNANRIVVGELDFHSALQLYSAQPRRGFAIDVVKSPDGARVRAEDVVAAIGERTAIVALSLVSRNGALLDVGPIVERARAVGALVMIDAYQGVGAVPIDAPGLEVDVLVGGFHKWLSGDTGLAFMYVRPSVAERLQPMYPGWFGHQDLGGYVREHSFTDGFRSAPGAVRFQQGTPAMGPVYASRAGLRLVLEMGVERIRRHNLELTERLLEGAHRLGIVSMTPSEPEQRGSFVCLQVPDPQAVVAELGQRGIDVDQRRLSVVRIAPHGCNTADDCDHFLHGLAEAMDRSTRGNDGLATLRR